MKDKGEKIALPTLEQLKQLYEKEQYKERFIASLRGTISILASVI